MLAKDFGYQVSPRPAKLVTPEIQAMVERDKQVRLDEKKTQKAAEGFVIVFGAVLLVVSLLVAGADEDQWILPVIVTLVMIVFSVGIFSTGRKTGASVLEREQMAASALTSPWQAWPCRLEAAQKKGANRRMLLLGPDGSIVGDFLSNMPDQVWVGMTDGRGLVWFAGDIRFGGVAALPGGRPMWWVRPTADKLSPPAQSGGLRRVAEEELTRQAIGFAFDQWLK